MTNVLNGLAANSACRMSEKDFQSFNPVEQQESIFRRNWIETQKCYIVKSWEATVGKTRGPAKEGMYEQLDNLWGTCQG